MKQTAYDHYLKQGAHCLNTCTKSVLMVPLKIDRYENNDGILEDETKRESFETQMSIQRRHRGLTVLRACRVTHRVK